MDSEHKRIAEKIASNGDFGTLLSKEQDVPFDASGVTFSS